MSDSGWYVVQCRANQNYRAQENLENQGFTCFQPQLCLEKVRAGRRVQRQEPLFPGYLFIQLSEQGSGWHTIRSTRGVTKLVAFGDRPAAVPPSVIDALKLQTQASANDDRPALRPGDRLRIEHGPFGHGSGVPPLRRPGARHRAAQHAP
ncbi:transcriptional activator RfaH [Alcanivorax sp. IO_7]|nr:transcriptional activator RfaH [Alcanivorax sp. IO_7]